MYATNIVPLTFFFLKESVTVEQEYMGLSCFFFSSEGKKLFCSGSEVFYSTERTVLSIKRTIERLICLPYSS